VVIIPGMMGTVLEQKDTGRRVWGNLLQLRALSPHRNLLDPSHDGLELSTTSTNLRENRDSLVPGGLLERMTIIPHFLSVGVYRRWVTILSSQGYRDGDINHPRKGDNCFVFFYDWHRDLVESAQLLSERIDAIRAAYGNPDLKVDLIAHSTGGLVARYYILYGGEDVLDSPTPGAPNLSGAAHVANLVLLGSPNEGSMKGFLAMLEGSRVGFRRISPLTLFTFPSCFEMLPPPGDPVFLDPEGLPVPVDLYASETWSSHRWSIYNPDVRERFRNECVKLMPESGSALFADKYDEWGRYLEAVLKRARRFHRSLDQDKRAALPTRYHLFGGDCKTTLGRSVVFDAGDEVRTAIHPSQRPTGMSRRAFGSLIHAPGDGTVVTTSLLGNPVSSGAKDAPAFTGTGAVWSCVVHDKIQNDLEVQRRVLEILMSPM
jgi:pimeloyl-ACP methyl ester carboxylesterase